MMQVLIRWSGALALAAVLALLAMQAKRTGDAYAWQFQSQSRLREWRQAKIAPSLDEWRVQQQHMQAALQVMPHNAAFITTLGLLDEFRAFRLEKRPREAFSHALRAIALYKQAAALNPAWMYGWLNLARLKWRLGRIDDEFFDAYMHVVRLGPWEKDSMTLLLAMALTTHELFPRRRQEQMLAYLFRIAGAKRVHPERDIDMHAIENLRARTWPELCRKLENMPKTPVSVLLCGQSNPVR